MPTAANLDGHALATRYEVLRHDVVASADRRPTLHSLALLMPRGMAAWIKDIGEEPPVCTENVIRVDDVTESLKLAE